MLLRENSSNFEFQGRTDIAAANSKATLFSAFAIRNGGDTVEVTKLLLGCKKQVTLCTQNCQSTPTTNPQFLFLNEL